MRDQNDRHLLREDLTRTYYHYIHARWQESNDADGCETKCSVYDVIDDP